MKRIIISAMLLLLAVSCKQVEPVDIPVDITEGDVTLDFYLETPEYTEVKTKALDDRSIRVVDLLVFSHNKTFLERISVNEITDAGNNKRFSVRMPAVPSETRTFQIVANGRDENNVDIVKFSALTLGMSMATAMTNLVTNTMTTGTAPKLPLVMWGNASLYRIGEGAQIGTVKMLRSVAALKVIMDTPTASNGLTKLKITSITAVNAPTFGRVAPSTYAATTTTTPTTPTIPIGVGMYNYATSESAGVWANAVANETSELYLYECVDNISTLHKGMGIVIRAKYNNVDTYYKVSLRANSMDEKDLDVIRNHKYIIKIIKATGPGHSTFAAAASDQNASDNIKITVIDDTDGITHMVTDGLKLLGVTAEKITVTGSGSKTFAKIIHLSSSIVPTATSSQTWLTSLNVFQTSPNVFELKGTFGTTSITRSTVVTIKAGKLQLDMTVEQKP